MISPRRGVSHGMGECKQCLKTVKLTMATTRIRYIKYPRTRYRTDTPLRWDRLGPPTMAACHAVLRRLPLDIRDALSPPQRELIAHILYLAWMNAHTKKLRTAYCSPSYRYLGSVCGRSRDTIRVYVERFRQLGLVRTTQLFFHPGPVTIARGQGHVRWKGHLRFYLGNYLLSALYKTFSTRRPVRDAQTPEPYTPHPVEEKNGDP
jgi:hypothetical protein